MRYFPFLVILFLTSCIGTDEVDAPIVGESIEIDREQVSLLIGDQTTVNAAYFNRYGAEEEVQLIWSTADKEIATIDLSGTVTAVGAGQTQAVAAYGAVESYPVLITVVENENDVAQVSLSSGAGSQISVGQEITLTVEVFNVLGDPITGLDVTYTALDPDYLSVDQNGVATGIANGFGRIVASVDGIQSNTLGIQVGQTSRLGTFSGANGYDASGTTELFIADNGDLMLRLNSDFDTDFALGTYIYLSNSTSGSVTRNEGLEIQEVTTGGSHLFNVSAIDSDITIDDFNYVIVLCKPATITFGYAELD